MIQGKHLRVIIVLGLEVSSGSSFLKQPTTKPRASYYATSSNVADPTALADLLQLQLQLLLVPDDMTTVYDPLWPRLERTESAVIQDHSSTSMVAVTAAFFEPDDMDTVKDYQWPDIRSSTQQQTKQQSAVRTDSKGLFLPSTRLGYSSNDDFNEFRPDNIRTVPDHMWPKLARMN